MNTIKQTGFLGGRFFKNKGIQINGMRTEFEPVCITDILINNNTKVKGVVNERN